MTTSLPKTNVYSAGWVAYCEDHEELGSYPTPDEATENLIAHLRVDHAINAICDCYQSNRYSCGECGEVFDASEMRLSADGGYVLPPHIQLDYEDENADA